MTITQVQYVLEIARCGSLSRAAETLYISQPALSSQVRALERELNCAIFQRTAKGVVLTEAGKKFCQSAEGAVREWNELQRRSAELREPLSATIRIGFDVRAQANDLIKPVLDTLSRRPETNVSFITDMNRSPFDALEEKRMDLSICRLPPPPAMRRRERFHIVPLLTERQCVLMSPEDSCSGEQTLPFSFLDGKSVVCGPVGSVDDTEMKLVSELYHFKVARVLRSDDIGTVMALIRGGHGYALGPPSFARRFSLAAVPLLPETEIDLNLICRREDRDNELFRQVEQVLLAAAAKHGK